MIAKSTEDLFRTAAEREGGLPVSAGARVSHVQLAMATGRVLHVDLSEVPADQRVAVIAEISELVGRARTRAQGQVRSPMPSTPISNQNIP